MRKIFFQSLLLMAGTAWANDPETTVMDRSLVQVSLALNWVPEPEFGGFYAADRAGIFDKNNLKVDLIPGGASSPTVQMLEGKKVEFAVTSGSEIIVARSRGAKVVAIYSIFETSPMGIMVHKSRKLKNLEDLFSQGGTLALQQGQAYVDFLKKKFPTSNLKIVPYTGGVTQFLRDESFAQQGFVFSEPVTAKQAGIEPAFFLLAGIGYNPYAAVVAVREDYLQKNESIVKSFVAAAKEGWALYKTSPQAANQKMGELNKAMNASGFEEGARNQNSLLGDGSMRLERWQEQIQQLKESKTISKDIDAASCFVNL